MELLDLVVSQLRCTYLQQIANSGEFHARQTEISHNGSAGCHTIGRKICGSACSPQECSMQYTASPQNFPPPGHQNHARRLRVCADHGDPDRFAQTYNVLYNFTGQSDGGNPQAGVTIDHAGNLYGTTFAGGSANCTGYATWDAARCSSCRIGEADGRWAAAHVHRHSRRRQPGAQSDFRP